jgi:drug/metabolite transporter (DMT)-like permease
LTKTFTRDGKGLGVLGNPQLLALCAAFLFGLALVLTQFGLKYLPPSRGAAISVPTSAILFLVLAPFLLDWGGWNPRGALIFALVGILFPATVTLLTFEANRRMGPNITGALINLTPVFAVIAAAVLLDEIPRPLQALGIAMVAIGVIILSVDRSWLGTRWAILLPIGIAAIAGLTVPVTKLGLALWPDPFAATLIGYLMSSVVVIGVATLGKNAPPKKDQRDHRGILWFGCVGVCNSLGVLAFYAALARGPVHLLSPLVGTYPLVTLAFSAILLRSTRIKMTLIVGVVTTVAGVILLVGT